MRFSHQCHEADHEADVTLDFLTEVAYREGGASPILFDSGHMSKRVLYLVPNQKLSGCHTLGHSCP